MYTQITIDYTDPTEVYEVLSRFINSGGGRPNASKEFIEAFMRDHNTLQQSVIRLLLELVAAQAENEYTDIRNADSRIVCKDMIDYFKSINHNTLPHQFLPFI